MLLLHRSMQTCECGFICTGKFNFERHQSSRRHEINMLCKESLVINEDGCYECNICNYCSSNEINYRRHVSSDKHKVAKERRAPMQTSIVSVTPQQTIAAPIVVMPNDVSGIEYVKPVMLVEVMEMCLNFMKQDRDSQNTQQTEMFKMFADRITAHQAQQVQLLQQTQQAQQLTNNANENTTTTTTGDHNTTTTTTTNNKKFNLNFFLNEQCKNAMNLTDFIDRLVVNMEDLEHMCEVGYTQGMSKIITKAMNDTQTTERPIHCSDAKRETMYVRKDDAWQKDPDKEECQRLINNITSKNYKFMSKWRQDNPDCQVSDSPEYEKWFKMTRAMCNADPAAMKKLIHNLALITEIEKQD